MKKLLPLIILFVILAHNAFGQMINLNKYCQYFSITKVSDIIDSDYVWAAADEEILSFGSLNWNGVIDHDTALVDTPFEFALLSYYSQPVLQIRPADADAILPANNPKLADTKLGAAVFQHMQVLRFLGDTAAVTRHENMLKFITDRGNVTRAEIEAFFRNNIRSLVSEIVNEEFSKIWFTLDNTTTRTSYDAVLKHNAQTRQYILEYERLGVKYEPIIANSVDALSSAMSRNNNFDQTSRSQIDTQASLLPAVVLSDRALTEITDILTRFFTEPNQSTYRAMLEATSILERAVLNTRDTKYSHVPVSWSRSLNSLNQEVTSKIYRELRTVGSVTTLTREQQQRLIQLR